MIVKRILLSLLALLVIFSTIYFVFRVTQSRKVVQPKDVSLWYTTDQSFNTISGDGRLISLKGAASGGIFVSPLNYQEKNRNFNISIYDPRKNTQEEKTILKDASEFTTVRLMQNQLANSKIWVIYYYAKNDCADNISCTIHVGEFDLDTGTFTAKSDLSILLKISSENSDKVSLHSIVPLIHDPAQNQIWIAYNIVDPKYSYSHYSVLQKKAITESKDSYITSLVAYNYNTNTPTTIPLNRAINFNNKVQNYDLDSDGNIYVDTGCIFSDCQGTDNLSTYSSSEQIYRLSTTDYSQRQSLVNIFTFSQDVSNREFSIDKTTNLLYLANHTWNQSPKTSVIKYSLKREISSQIGLVPIENKDDVRGILAVQGKLVLASFTGLRVYDKATDTYGSVTTKNGLRDNNSETIQGFSGGFCVRHENNGSSCFYGSASQLL